MKLVIIWILLLAGVLYGQQPEKSHEAVEKMYFSADFEDGTIAPMEVGQATCAIDATTGANGSQQSVKCTCKYTAKGTTSCSGGGGQAEISFTYPGVDPGWEGEVWESWYFKTDRATAKAASEPTRSQIKLHLLRSGNGNCAAKRCPWLMYGFGYTFADDRLRILLDDFSKDHSVNTKVNVADEKWHRVVQRRRQVDGKGCVTVYVDDMQKPAFKEHCERTIGSEHENYTFRVGITYAAYSGDKDGRYAVWIDEVQSASHDIR